MGDKVKKRVSWSFQNPLQKPGEDREEDNCPAERVQEEVFSAHLGEPQQLAV